MAEISFVEQEYRRLWGLVGGAGRLRRTVSLHASIRRMIEHQIQSSQPGLSDRDLAVQVARRMYLSDAGAQRLLDAAQGEIMWPLSDFEDSIQRISAILDELGLRFHFTGGVASSYYGDPRLTQDLDVVIQLAVDRPETRTLLDRLSAGYIINKPDALAAIAQSGLFQAIDETSMIKIDFHVGGKIPGELERTTRRSILPGVVVPLICKEDAILSKLLWIKQGSHKSWHDVTMMLCRDEDMDRASLNERAARLGLGGLLAEIENEDGMES
jgi:hypothetical protein